MEPTIKASRIGSRLAGAKRCDFALIQRYFGPARKNCHCRLLPFGTHDIDKHFFSGNMAVTGIRKYGLKPAQARDELELVTIDHPHPKKWLYTDPMVIAAVLFIVGIILGRYANPPMTAVWITAAAFFGAAILLLLGAALAPDNRTCPNQSMPGGKNAPTKSNRIGPEHIFNYPQLARYTAWVLMALTLVAAGMARWQINQHRLARNSIARAAPVRGRRFITARMLIISEPEFHPAPPRGILFSAVGPSTTFFARVRATRFKRRWIPATGNVVVRVPGYLPALRNNQYIALTGWLSRPPTAENPGGFNYRQYLTAFRVFAELSASQIEQIHVLSTRQTLFPLGGWLDAWRSHLRKRLIADHPKNQRTDGYALIALLLGYRDPAIRPLARAFSRAGAAHLLALSGMHVVIIAAAIWLLLKFFIHRPRYRALATLILVFIYMLMTPCGPPVVRAAVGTGLVLISWILGRPVRALNILATTALIVTLWRPAELFQPPFQLSFIVTLGLILLTHRVHRVLFHAWLTRQGDIARAIGSRWAMLKVGTMAWLAAITTANMVGSFVALPLVAYHYNQLNPLAIINGLILLPLVAAALIAGLIEMAAGFGSSTLGHAAAMIAGPIAHALAWTVTHLAALPGSEIIVRSPPIILILLFFTVLLAWMFRRNMRLPRWVIAGAFACWALGCGVWYAAAASNNAVHIWVFNVGSGDCVVIHARRTVLLDAGSLGSPARMAETVDTALRRLGWWHINSAIITQIDSAHAAAMLNIAQRHGGLTGWCDAMDFHSPRTASAKFLQAAGTAGLIPQPAESGQAMGLGLHCRLSVLWPKQGNKIARKVRGLILLLHHQPQRVLFIGRTEAVASVLRKIHIARPLTGVVLLGSGSIHPPLVRWLVKENPQWVVATGETRAASMSDKNMLVRTALHLFQTRALGSVHIVLHHGDSLIRSQSRRTARAATLDAPAAAPDQGRQRQ